MAALLGATTWIVIAYLFKVTHADELSMQG